MNARFIKNRRTGAIPLILLLTCGWATWAGAQDKLTSYDVQGGCIVNFARFATWHETAPDAPEDEFVIGIVGANPFGKLFDKQTVEQRDVRVEQIKRPDKATGCHALYINLKKKADVANCLEQIKPTGILTISEHPDFRDAGGMIQFVKVQQTDNTQKVRYMVNAKAAEQAKIKLGAVIQKHAIKPEEIGR